MSSPLLSVVVPTRQRPETLRYCLQTCLDQDFTDYEIVVADNFSSPETRQVVEAAASPRIRYLRSSQPLAMSANWENGVAAARGRYVTLIGDDDGLMPFALREAAQLLQEHDFPQALHWARGLYTWPTLAIPEDANFLSLPVARQKHIRRGRDLINDVINFRCGAELLPTIHSSFLHRDLILRLRDTAGRVFPTIYPDDFTSFAFGWMLEEYLSIDVPMHVAGVGGRSNGVATILRPEGDPVAADFWNLNSEGNFRPHPRVPNLPLYPVHTADSFEFAKQYLFPDDESLAYDRTEMTVRYLEAIPAVDVPTRSRYRAEIRAALADRPDLQSWFDREAPQPPPLPWLRLKPEAMGFDGEAVRMDTSDLGIEDIAAAVRLAASVVGVGNDPIRWDLPQRQHLLAQLQAGEQRVREAEAARDKARQDRDVLRRKLQLLRARHQDLKHTSAAKVRRTETPPAGARPRLRRLLRRVRNLRPGQ